MTRLNHSLSYIEDYTGILPSVIAERVVWDKLDNSKLSNENIEKIAELFSSYTEKHFTDVFNVSLHFRKVCAAVNSIDDLKHIDAYVETWFDSWYKRFIKQGFA